MTLSILRRGRRAEAEILRQLGKRGSITKPILLLIFASFILGSLSTFYYYSYEASPQINVTSVNVQYHIVVWNICTSKICPISVPPPISPLNLEIEQPGFSSSTGSVETLSIEAYGWTNSSHIVNVTSVSVKTAGFSILSISPATPITLPANQTSTTFVIRLMLPAASYSGTINLVVNETQYIDYTCQNYQWNCGLNR
jgi:hypothetical protein